MSLDQLQCSTIADHILQYLIEPITVIEAKFKYLSIRRNLSQMEVLGLIRQRVGFFGICNLFDRVEMKFAETDVTTEILNRHSERLKMIEKSI